MRSCASTNTMPSATNSSTNGTIGSDVAHERLLHAGSMPGGSARPRRRRPRIMPRTYAVKRAILAPARHMPNAEQIAASRRAAMGSKCRTPSAASDRASRRSTAPAPAFAAIARQSPSRSAARARAQAPRPSRPRARRYANERTPALRVERRHASRSAGTPNHTNGHSVNTIVRRCSHAAATVATTYASAQRGTPCRAASARTRRSRRTRTGDRARTAARCG